jgi:hypothetical protein
MPCYTFNEARGTFAFWGRNSVLRLVTADLIESSQARRGGTAP